MSKVLLHLEKSSLGRKGEELAAAYLLKQKYRIIKRNFICKCGELDIVAKDGKIFVFVEVKTRRNMTYGPPQLSVTKFKQRQISKAALFYMAQNKISDAIARFDVIAIMLSGDEKPQIDHIKNAFDLAY